MEAHTAGEVHVQLRPIFICSPSVHSSNNTWLENSISIKLFAYEEQEGQEWI